MGINVPMTPFPRWKSRYRFIYRRCNAGNGDFGTFIGISIPETAISDWIFPFPAWKCRYRIKYLHFHGGNGVIGTFIAAATVELRILERLSRPREKPERQLNTLKEPERQALATEYSAALGDLKNSRENDARKIHEKGFSQALQIVCSQAEEGRKIECRDHTA